GRCPDPVPSTVVDLSGEAPRVLREGAIPWEKLREVAPDLLPAQRAPEPEADPGPDAGDRDAADAPVAEAAEPRAAE
ncbi:MAG: hypothetical protein ACRDT8_24660, partial [Micromonosporaceae bacterium]